MLWQLKKQLSQLLGLLEGPGHVSQKCSLFLSGVEVLAPQVEPPSQSLAVFLALELVQVVIAAVGALLKLLVGQSEVALSEAVPEHVIGRVGGLHHSELLDGFLVFAGRQEG